MTELEVNKIIAQFIGANYQDEELKYTSSWDLLIPIYQKLYLNSEELSDENWIYITNEMYDKLDVMTQTPKEFAYLLAEIINQYNAILK
jgi:predicted alternative tryptophan synthase beta-subunit